MTAQKIVINGHTLNNSEVEILLGAFASSKAAIVSGPSRNKPGADTMVKAIEKLEGIVLRPLAVVESHIPDEATSPKGFNALGHPVPATRKKAGYELCIKMGIQDKDVVWQLIEDLARLIEGDKPFEAQEHGLKHLDLTGYYRLMAVLLSA